MRVRIPRQTASAVALLATTSPVLAQPEPARCPPPVVEARSQVGGQLQFKIQSPCRKGELIFGRYGRLLVIEKLDANGDVIFQLDCFMGDLKVDLSFQDKWHSANHSCSAVDPSLTKVAIVWRDR